MPIPMPNQHLPSYDNAFALKDRMNRTDIYKKESESNALLKKKEDERNQEVHDELYSPEVVEWRNLKRQTETATNKLLLQEQKLKTGMAVSKYIGGRIGTAYRALKSGVQDPEKFYKEFYDSMVSDDVLGEDAKFMLPSIDDFAQVDISNPDGKSLNKDARAQVTAVLGNLMTAAERKAEGLDVQYKQAWLPDGKDGWRSVYVAANLVPTKAGEVLDAATILGVEGATFNDPTANLSKLATAAATISRAQTAKEALDEQKSQNKAENERAEEKARLDAKEREAKDPANKVKSTWINEEGELLVTMENGVTKVQNEDGELVVATPEQKKNLKKVDTQPGELEDLLAGKVKEALRPEGEEPETEKERKPAKKVSKGKRGTRDNPYLPRTNAEIEALPKGSFYRANGGIWKR